MILSWFNDAGELASIEFDTFLRESREATNTVADHPVGGVVYSDHVIVGPMKYTFDCYVSDSPSSAPTTQTGGRTGSVQSVNLETGSSPELTKAATDKAAAEYERRAVKGAASVLRFDGELRRRDLVFRELERLRRNVTPVFVTEAVLSPIDYVLITSVTAPVSDAGDGITFSIGLREILSADSETARLEPDEPRAIAPVDSGGTTTEVIEESSLLYRAVVGGGIL